jgi:hypothetical protein
MNRIKRIYTDGGMISVTPIDSSEKNPLLHITEHEYARGFYYTLWFKDGSAVKKFNVNTVIYMTNKEHAEYNNREHVK